MITERVRKLSVKTITMDDIDALNKELVEEKPMPVINVRGLGLFRFKDIVGDGNCFF